MSYVDPISFNPVIESEPPKMGGLSPASSFDASCNHNDIRTFYTSELSYLKAMRKRYACQFCATSSRNCPGCTNLDERIKQLEEEERRMAKVKVSYTELIDRVIEDGIKAVLRDYTDDNKIKGSISGFESCRGKTPYQLIKLLNMARQHTMNARNTCYADNRVSSSAYWYWRCRELEIEWVCNVVSAVLMNKGLPTIINPTARGMIKAAEIVGVEDE